MCGFLHSIFRTCAMLARLAGNQLVNLSRPIKGHMRYVRSHENKAANRSVRPAPLGKIHQWGWGVASSNKWWLAAVSSQSARLAAACAGSELSAYPTPMAASQRWITRLPESRQQVGTPWGGGGMMGWISHEWRIRPVPEPSASQSTLWEKQPLDATPWRSSNWRATASHFKISALGVNKQQKS